MISLKSLTLLSLRTFLTSLLLMTYLLYSTANTSLTDSRGQEVDIRLAGDDASIRVEAYHTSPPRGYFKAVEKVLKKVYYFFNRPGVAGAVLHTAS